MGCNTCGKKVYTNNYTKQLNETLIKKATVPATNGTKTNTITVNGVKFTTQ